MNNDIQNSLFDAMKAFMDYSKNTTTSTITIETSITEVVDKGVGQYAVEYLGNTFDVYSGNTNAIYSVGDKVYVLIPDNDFTKTKIILGKVSPSASDYVVDNSNSNYYQISDNLIDADLGVIEMSSYGTTENTEKITSIQASIFSKLLNGYLSNYRTFALSFNAKTSMTLDQQGGRGNYGVILNIPLISADADGGGTQTAVWKNYTLDASNMLGTYYRFDTWTPQTLYFTLDEQYTYDSSKVPLITYFCYGWPQDETKTDIKDILLKDISFSVVDELSETDTTGYKLTLKASEGEYFSTNYRNTKILTPTLRVNGNVTTISAKNSEVYWFKEDAEVASGNKYYSPYGGYGWKCLNEKTNLTMADDGTETFDYVTSALTWNIDKDDIKSSARFKCVVVYDEVEVSATITLKNLDSTIDFQLIPTNGSNVFVKDTGYVNLTAKVYYEGITEKEDYRNSILYSWIRYDKNGNYIADDSNFFTVVENNKMANSYYETIIKFPVNAIEDSNVIYCSAKLVTVDTKIREELIGTEEIQVTTAEDFGYSLVINNGNQIFKYDTDGDSPAGSAYDGPSTSKVTSIPALTFTIRKEDGTELTTEEYNYVHYCWCVPKNSLFTVSSYTSEDDDFYYFAGYDNASHTASLTYGIANRYNVSKSNNTIVLKCEFQDNSLESYAAISFLKEGESGSNGTKFAAELVSGGASAGTSVPYGTLNASGVAQKLKFVYNISKGKLYRHDYNTNSLVELARDSYGNYISDKRIYPLVYENSTAITNYSIEYSMFDYKYTKPCFYLSNVSKTTNTNKKAWLGSTTNGPGVLLALAEAPALDGTYCNIVQAQVTVTGQGSSSRSNQIIYCYYPIELTVVNFDTGIIPSVDGGFAEVMYAADGTNPSWDETSSFACNDDGLISKNLADYFTINWTAQHHLSPESGNGNSFAPKPKNKYDDGDSLNLVTASLVFNNDKKESLTKEVSELQEKDTAYQKYIGELNKTLEYLNNFAKAWDYDNWEEILDEIKVLLNQQTNAVYVLNESVENALVSLDNYLNLQATYNNKQVSVYCKDLINQLSELKNMAVKAAVQIQHLDGTEGYDYSNLISLVDYKISWSDEIKQKYIDGLGQDMALTLQIMIAEVNDNADVYENSYNGLMNLSSSNYLEYYKKIQEKIKSMCAEIKDDAAAQYLDVRNKCLLYLDSFNNYTSVKDILDCIKKMYNNVLKGIFVLEDNVLFVSDATTQEINDKITTYQNYISDNKVLISGYNKILATSGYQIKHFRPIVFYFNRYGMSNINAWDGNKTEVNDGYILTPQIGAGVKNSDNSFTGVVMGLKKLSNTGTTRKGLYGYAKGVQSFALDAENGAAIFGKASSGGQIIIDPSSTKAMLYSSSYYTSYNKETGLPINYASHSNSGMLIDLTTPEIRFGNGNFVVNSNGHITAKGGGTIAGWTIGDTTLTGGGTTLNSDGTITCRVLNANNSGSIGGWSISSGSLSGGGTTLNSNGTVTCNVLQANNSGSIGGWTINSNSLSKGGIVLSSAGSITGTGFVLNANGLAFSQGTISLGSTGANKTGISYSRGKCVISGDIYANNCYLQGTVSASGVTFSNGSGGYIKMNGETNHPEISGINIGAGGINMHNHGISNLTQISGANNRNVSITSSQKINMSASSVDITGYLDVDAGSLRIAGTTIGSFVDNKINAAKITGTVIDSRGKDCTVNLSISI